MHLAQALTLWPEANLAHCKLGCFLLLIVGLYLPRSLTLFQTMVEVLPQILHCFAIFLHHKTKPVFYQDLMIQ